MRVYRLLSAYVTACQVVKGVAFLISSTCTCTSRHTAPRQPRYNVPSTGLKKRSVEQVDIESCEIIKTYDSIAEAAEEVGCARPNISRVLKKKSKSAAGFFWRQKGHTDLPESRKLHSKTRTCEQIDMDTLEVVAVYPSAAAAARAIGGRLQSICRIMNRERDRSSYKGFYWRQVGDTSEPHQACTKKTIPQEKQPVQQICPDTGTVIATFDSAAAAGKALGIKSYTITKVLRGLYQQTGGFQFRAVGEPRKFKRDYTARRVHQICPDTGDIVRTFPSLTQAGKAVGVTGASISSAAHGTTNTSAGYRWELAVHGDDHDNNSIKT